MAKMDYIPIREEGVWPICPHCLKVLGAGMVGS